MDIKGYFQLQCLRVDCCSFPSWYLHRAFQ